MAGWYVEILLKNRNRIRSQIFSTDDIYRPNDEDGELFENESEGSAYDGSYSIDFDDFDYNNLLIVEKKLLELLNKNQISTKENLVLQHMITGKSLSKLEEETGLSRVTISHIFSEVCGRIAFLLGDIFTDSGYLDYLGKKYKLTEEQLEKAMEFMNSNKKHSG